MAHPPVNAETIGVVLELAAHHDCRRALSISAFESETALALASVVARVVIVSTSVDARLRVAEPPTRAPNVDRGHASPFSLPFARGSFDLVTCRVAAHHLHLVRPALDEIVRVMAPAGIFVLADSLDDDDQWIDDQIQAGPDAGGRVDHSPATWCRLLEEHGLLVDTTVTTRSSPGSAVNLGARSLAATGSIGGGVQPRVEQTCAAGRDAALHRAHWRGAVIGARKP